MGLYTVKHTDGNIMPVIEQIVGARPHAIHSLDSVAGVNIKEVKCLYGDRVCLIGNVPQTVGNPYKPGILCLFNEMAKIA